MKKIIFALTLLLSLTTFAQRTTVMGSNIFLQQEGTDRYATFKYTDNDGNLLLVKREDKIVMTLTLDEGYQFGNSGDVDFVITFKKGDRLTEYTTYGKITEGLKLAIIKTNIKDDAAFLTSFLSSDYMLIDMNGDTYFYSLEESTKAYQFLK
jgi:hypothetical protein